MKIGISNRKEALTLLVGDIIFFLVALWLTLLFRYFDIPSNELWVSHILPFSIIFAIWVFVFFVAGLYEKHTLMLKSRLPSIILRTQIINSAIAVLFFYLIPYFVITPKTNLFIDLVFSFGFIYFWRVYLVSFLGFKKREKALLIGSGKEMKELVHLLAERREAKKAADSSLGAQVAAPTDPSAAFPPSDAAIGATIPAPAPVGSQPPPAPSDPEIGRGDSERFGSTDRYRGDAQYD